MPMFDLEKTAELERLFRTPREQRDANWVQQFYAAAPDASLKTSEQQLIRGPDGFPYLALYLPPEREEFTAFCIRQVMTNCLEHGAGCVIAPDQSAPEWVFTYGNLWSLHSYDTFDATPANAEQKAAPQPGRQVLIASPSEKLLPTFARNVIRHFLIDAGIKRPRVLLLADASATPPESLVFSIYPDDFEDPSKFNDIMGRLKNWFLPPHYGLVALPRSGHYESHFVAL